MVTDQTTHRVNRPYMSTISGRSISPKVTRYVAALIRKEVAKGVTFRELGRRAKVSHSQLVNIHNGESGVGWKTLQGLADAFDTTVDGFIVGSRDFDPDNPAPPPRRDARIEYDTPRAPVVGAMEGFDEALAAAKKRYRLIPDYAWEEVAHMTGFRIRPPVTPELLMDLALVVAKHGEPAPED